MLSPLQSSRNKFRPVIPHQISRIIDCEAFATANILEPLQDQKELKERFPLTYGLPIYDFKQTSHQSHAALKVGVVFSGGQAAGGHNVISGLYDALKKLNHESTLIGFLNGPSGIIKNQFIRLDETIVDKYRNLGGFDMIGSGRTKIETPEQFASVEDTVRKNDLNGLIIIGGDDSNTNAALLAEYFVLKNLKTSVLGVPKTIDGDLANAYIEIPFGFDSACKTYSELIGNLLTDSLSAKKYTFFVKLMGRTASHIALECALQTHANLTFIGEEKLNLKEIVKRAADVIENRSKAGKDYGLILIPEGLIEFIPDIQKDLPEKILKQLTSDLDSHGNVQVSKIETEKLLIELVQEELEKRQFKGKFSPVPLFFGYEGRSCLPTNFDAQYCYSLGIGAALLLNSGATGYICCIEGLSKPVDEWTFKGIPIMSMMGYEERAGKRVPVIKKHLVDLEGPLYKFFKKNSEKWATEDDYINPGPIQFFGPKDITDSVTFTLKYRNQSCGSF